MAASPRSTNFVILALFVVAVFVAGVAIFYFGGGTQEFHDASTPEELDPSVERAAPDGLGPGLKPPPSGEGG